VHSRRAVPIHRSAIAFARGARTGVLMTRAPSEMNTSAFLGTFDARGRRACHRTWRVDGEFGLATTSPQQ
jgi:hypothetical protein